MARVRILRTARCDLTTWVAEDWRAVMELTDDPAMMAHISHGKPWTAERCREFVARQIAQQDELGFCSWRVTLRDDDGLAGVCGVQPTVAFDGIELTWWVARNHWGQGLASECARAVVDHAFAELGLGRLLAIVDRDNAASVRVAEKLGMTAGDKTDYAGFRVVVFEACAGGRA